ncbi:hypothetical protein WOLCODRAFT_155193 [Wolfiporia cocos MD-104 SS10]|uniref:Uncharacterized protein n=1 Tax=Wolfiporia cocos (strain MD-104) TaxID=742152 RepID=A0A2H3J423_WOLCO|nr:hypothetical protein WOLCODRAFT_155193 [Wolfiporia cocos MD-104 SS10]
MHLTDISFAFPKRAHRRYTRTNQTTDVPIWPPLDSLSRPVVIPALTHRTFPAPILKNAAGHPARSNAILSPGSRQTAFAILSAHSGLARPSSTVWKGCAETQRMAGRRYVARETGVYEWECEQNPHKKYDWPRAIARAMTNTNARSRSLTTREYDETKQLKKLYDSLVISSPRSLGRLRLSSASPC